MELFVVIAAIAFLGLMALGLLKMLFWLLVLPFKIGALLLKGVFGLIFLIPLAIFGALAVSVVLPVFVGVLALPVLVVVAGVIALVKCVF